MNLYVKTHGHTWLCAAGKRRVNALRLLIKNQSLLMKISILAILLTFSGLLMAGSGEAQDLNKIVVSIELKNATLKQAFRKIESLARLPFTYKTNDVSAYNNINYYATNATVAQILGDLLRDTDLQYELLNSNIVIKKASKNSFADPRPLPAPVAQALFDGGIKGTVKDAGGAPIVNASIQLTGTEIGTAANASGEFTITGVKAGNYRLQVSAIGYETVVQSVTVKDNEISSISVELQNTVANMSEVVVTALGISRNQRSLGYATQQIKGDNLTYTKEQNVLGSLAGKVAGVQVIGSSGASMGGTQKIKIRGFNSIGGGDQPLVVIDGTPVSNTNFAGNDGPDLGNMLQDLNPDDVESINVLKGPAATALYGLRGQYGVLMITTKKGKKNDRIQVDFSSAFSVERAGNFMPLQDVYGGGTSQTFSTVMVNGVATPYVSSADESWGPKMDGTLVRHRNSWYPADPEFGQMKPFNPHPDNLKDFYETGRTINNGVSFSGGSQTAGFRLSYNYTDIEGVIPNSWLKRNNLGFNGSLQVTNKITISTSLNYANNKAQRPDQGYTHSGANYFLQWFQRSLDMKQLKNYKYSDGRFLQWNGSNPTNATVASLSFLNNKPSDWNNPYFNVYENPSNDNRDRFFGNVQMAYSPIKELKLSGTVRADMYVQNIETRKGAGGFDLNSFSISKYQNREVNYEFLAQFDKTFGDFSLVAVGGTNFLQRRYDYLSQATAGGLTAPNFFNIEGSKDRPVVSNYLDRKEIFSWFATATFGYKDLVFLDASVRQDFSSALPENNNGYTYPSVSASFVFSDLIKWKPLNYGKVRVGLARGGSDVGTQLTTNPYAPSIDGSLVSIYLPNTLNNPNLKPSYSDAFEAGLVMQFFNNRLGFDISYYKQNNKNQVLNLNISGSTGYTGTIINAGNIENKGIELSINATPVKGKKFSWDMMFNASHNKSMVKELIPEYNITNYIMTSNTYSGVSMYVNARVGEAYGILVGRGYQRDVKTGKILLGTNNQPLYEDNHVFGNIVPQYTGGFTNTFRYGNWDLTAMIDFQKGGMFFSWSKMLAIKSGQAAETAAINANGKNVRDPVASGGGVLVNGISAATGAEVSTYVDGKVYYRTTLGTHVYEEWAYDASYIKLREARLGYTFYFKNIIIPVKSVNLAIIGTRSCYGKKHRKDWILQNYRLALL
jgi:TonB-linked SusC/RagA family outer membrane protein